MYTIKIHGHGLSVPRVILRLEWRTEKSRFYAVFQSINYDTIHVKPVRLRTPKPYCGQHPGECFIGPQRKGRWLEWDDWVEFHGLVNDVLDDLKANADVWTNPPEKMDKGRKMWVRRGLRRRINWDYTVEYNALGRPLATWNHGTEDQFIEVTNDAIHQGSR